MSSAIPSTILCVHPNRELYGSDRTFLQAVRAFRSRWPDAVITALIPGDGLLADALQQLDIGIQVRFDDIFVLRRSNILTLPRELLALRRRILAARRTMAGCDLVYINTVVVLDFLLASRTRRAATLVHVHELPVGVTRWIFDRLLARTRGRIVFISDAVRREFGASAARGQVIWNGTRASPVVASAGASLMLNILLIGRFNAWKGQGILLDALATLTPAQRVGLRVRIVGSAFGDQHHFTDAIKDKVQEHNLGDVVTIEPFAMSPEHHYRWADVVVVPSVKPEPFGLVAIEGMAAGRPVIASDHGGLAEIVEHDITGLLFTPGDPASLAGALIRYAVNHALVRRHGEAARARFEAEFDESIHMQRLADAAAEALAASA